jgi:hypothetical protein
MKVKVFDSRMLCERFTYFITSSFILYLHFNLKGKILKWLTFKEYLDLQLYMGFIDGLSSYWWGWIPR